MEGLYSSTWKELSAWLIGKKRQSIFYLLSLVSREFRVIWNWEHTEITVVEEGTIWQPALSVCRKGLSEGVKIKINGTRVIGIVDMIIIVLSWHSILSSPLWSLKIHFLYADLLSAEWRVFQNWVESGTVQNVHHLVATVHLQWAGFEVAGTNEEVLRYWFSVLQGLWASGHKLVHSSKGEGHSILKQTVANAHSSYTLSWVNTRHWHTHEWTQVYTTSPDIVDALK